jgi:hypothetical protein
MPEHAALSVLTFFGTAFLLALTILVLLLAFWKTRTRVALGAAAFGLVLLSGYLTVLLGVSLTSHEKLLAPGERKYFCEVDCHIAYSVVSVEETSALGDELHQPVPRAASSSCGLRRGSIRAPSLHIAVMVNSRPVPVACCWWMTGAMIFLSPCKARRLLPSFAVAQPPFLSHCDQVSHTSPISSLTFPTTSAIRDFSWETTSPCPTGY